MPGLAGRRALVKVSGTATVFTDQATTNQGDNKTYQITNAAMRVWAQFVAITVKIGGVSQPPNGADPYTINRLNGKVIFTNVNGGRAAVTVSGSYLPMATAIGAREYSFTLTNGIVDDTDFDTAFTNNGARTKLSGIQSIAATLGLLWRTDGAPNNEPFKDALLTPAVLVVQFFADRSANPSMIFWAQTSLDSLRAALEGAVDKNVQFEGAADNEGRVFSLP